MNNGSVPRPSWLGARPRSFPLCGFSLGAGTADRMLFNIASHVDLYLGNVVTSTETAQSGGFSEQSCRGFRDRKA